MVGKMRSIAALLACPKVSLMCISTAVLGVFPVAAKISLNRASPREMICGAVWKLRNTNL